MHVLMMIGDHPRHRYVARAAVATGLVRAVIVQRREAHVPTCPIHLDAHTQKLFELHFAGRASAEATFFQEKSERLEDIEELYISRDELNGQLVHDFIRRFRPGLLLSYGIHKLSEGTLACVSGVLWNIHGGLSPWYRGAITHFWPSYMLEPQMTGVTVHELTQSIDGGAIVHQACAPMVVGDGIHELACRAVCSLADDLPELLQRSETGDIRPPRLQRTTGRIWREADWRPEHLRVIYDLYDNRIVDRYLSGEFSRIEPKLIRQL